MPPAVRARRRRRTLAAGLAAAVVVSLLPLWPTWNLFEGRIFDFALTIAPPAPERLAGEAPVLVVAIDEPAFADLARQWPWPRSLHGELVARLREAGARVVGLDILFAEPSLQAEDAALAAALGPDTVLAADEVVIETPQVTQLSRVEPPDELLANGPRTGIVAVTLDGDGVLRRLPAYPDGFARQVLAAAGLAAAGRDGALDRLVRGERRYLRAFGPARTYPTVSYYQALDPEALLPPGLFEGRLVLVGFSLQTPPTVQSGGSDAFATAFTALTGRLVPGVEVQATILDNLRHGLWIDESRRGLQVAAALAVGLAAAIVAWKPAGLAMLVAGAGLVAGVLGASFLLVHLAGLWLPPAAPALAALLVLGPVAGSDLAAERRLRRNITRAFSQYLAPELVARLASDPGALRLGGERRVLSVLFSDVRGFTSIAEAMQDEPERLTALINRLLDPLSDAILRHGGTIDKYIGDCVMGFWNAPLDDPDHALHAVEAGLEMVEAVRRLNVEIAREAEAAGEHAPAISVGVGINTGACIVGNMGSHVRFDYTALGDAVNLASRLEGLTRTYAVDLVIGEDTARAVAGRFALRKLDEVAVKGRSGRTPVFTVDGAADAGGTVSPLSPR